MSFELILRTETQVEYFAVILTYYQNNSQNYMQFFEIRTDLIGSLSLAKLNVNTNKNMQFRHSGGPSEWLIKYA